MSEQEHGHSSVPVLKPEVPQLLVVNPYMCASWDAAPETALSAHGPPARGLQEEANNVTERCRACSHLCVIAHLERKPPQDVWANMRGTTNAVMACLARTRPDDTVHPSVRFDRQASRRRPPVVRTGPRGVIPRCECSTLCNHTCGKERCLTRGTSRRQSCWTRRLPWLTQVIASHAYAWTWWRRASAAADPHPGVQRGVGSGVASVGARGSNTSKLEGSVTCGTITVSPWAARGGGWSPHRTGWPTGCGAPRRSCRGGSGR
jgi:hypothetical protein